MKNAIVTGANGKIGRTFVDSLVTNGYFVYALDLNTDGFKTSKNVELIKLDITEEESVHDFFLYIDEFQNYVTDSIESILSEARKYRLSLNIAHQYLGQLEQSDALTKSNLNLKQAILGNV